MTRRPGTSRDRRGSRPIALVMALSFVLDEHFRGPLWTAVQRHNLRGQFVLNAVRVGDVPNPPLSSDDPTVIAWAGDAGRLLVTEDRRTIPGYLANWVAAGNHSPGILMVCPNSRLAEVVEYLTLNRPRRPTR